MRNKFKQLVLVLLLASSPLVFTGCQSTLAPAGVYNGNAVLYNADKVINGSYSTLHTFVKWEYTNRVALTKYPEIGKSADYIRDNAKKWITTAIIMREQFAKLPTKENSEALQYSVTVLKSALSEATKYLSVPVTK